MKTIQYHGKKLANKNFDRMVVDEKNLLFFHHLAVAEAILLDEENQVCGHLLGVITDDFCEVDYQDDDVAGEYLCFSENNQTITRLLGDDFLIQTRTPFRAIDDTKTRHIRFQTKGSHLIQENIGSYYQTTNHDGIVITGFYKNRLYDLTTGQFLTREYDRLSVIEEDKDRFLAEDVILSSHNLFSDHLLFEINPKGEVLSNVFSKKKNDYLDYGEFYPLSDYTFLRTQELFFGCKPSRGKIYVFEKYTEKRR